MDDAIITVCVNTGGADAVFLSEDIASLNSGNNKNVHDTHNRTDWVT